MVGLRDRFDSDEVGDHPTTGSGSTQLPGKVVADGRIDPTAMVLPVAAYAVSAAASSSGAVTGARQVKFSQT
jgi:hypothetical protein